MPTFFYEINMKTTFILLFSLTIWGLFTGFGGKDILVKGNIMHTRTYCGGAAPSEDMIDNMKKEIPFANHKFVIKKGTGDLASQTVFKEISTDEKGNFSIALPKGTYSVFIIEKTQDYEKGMMAQFGRSEGCKKWKNAPDFVITVTKKIKAVQTFKMHLGCNGCTPPRP